MEKQELTTKKPNEVTLSGGQRLQVQLMAELEKASDLMGVEMTDYGKRCAVNAIGGLVSFCKTNGIDLKSLDTTLLRTSIQNIGYTELNYSAGEVYFDIRRNTKANDGTYVAVIKPQGAGNEKLVRTYGVGIKKDVGLRTPWIIHEGDEFTLPAYEGMKVIPPTFRGKYENMSKKVILVVYPVLKIDGSEEYLIADRNSVKQNIIAQVRNNTLYSKMSDSDKAALYDKLNKDAETMDIDSFIDKYYEHISPAYTSGGSKESMIIRKMKNNALKPYPKEYDNAAIKEAVENMYEDADDTLLVKPTAVKDVDVVEKVDEELKQDPNEEPIADFEVEEGKKEEPTPKPKKVSDEAKPDIPSSDDVYEEMF